MNYKILIITSYDSFLKSAIEVAENINHSKIDLSIRLNIRNKMTRSQIDSLINKDYEYSIFYSKEYQKILLDDYDIILVSDTNKYVIDLLTFFRQKYPNKIYVTLFSGVIFGDIESIIPRLHGNIILCNNHFDYKIALKLKELYALKIECIQYGLATMKKKSFNTPKNIYYIDQVKIPSNKYDRTYLAISLITLAKRYSNENIIIKSRIKPNQTTIHLNSYPLESIIKELSNRIEIPQNISFTYDDIYECLSHAKLVLTISSTVGMESIYNQIPTIFIKDFGIKKEFYNYSLIDSDCMMNIEDIDLNSLIFHVNDDWYQEYIFFEENRSNILNKSLKNLKKKSNSLNKVNQIYFLSREYINFLDMESRKKKSYLKKIKQIGLKSLLVMKKLLLNCGVE